jgi:predicted Zn-dependent protease with MMP-like domain
VDFPDEETLEQMGAETEFDLLGLFRGRGLAQSEAVPQTGAFRNMIWLYRRPCSTIGATARTACARWWRMC